MGMAASQARYLALAARRSNCEYEGQQINQARTQKEIDFIKQIGYNNLPICIAKTQYSFTDGLNASTIDSWKQLGVIDENYNYVVTHHYYADVYTGSQKLMENPQVRSRIGIKEDKTLTNKAVSSPTPLTFNKS